MLLTLALTLWLEVHHTISLSILDSFTLHNNAHCPSTSSPYGRAHRTLEESALMCLIYADYCAHFNWHDINENEPLSFADQCSYASYFGVNAYSLNDDPESWIAMPTPMPTAVPGMQVFADMNSPDNFYGYMLYAMPEDECYFHCLITDCVGVVFVESDSSCWFKGLGWGNDLVNEAGTKTAVKSVLSGCVSGHSCYALLTHQNGQSRDKAQESCEYGGGHLAEFGSQAELDAVTADGRFAVLHGPVWLGVRYTGGQWSGRSGPLTVLPWMSGQPAATSEGTFVVATPYDTTTPFGFSTADASALAFPLCEYPAISMSTRGEAMSELNDGDETSCVSFDSPAAAAGVTLKTLHLHPASLTAPQQLVVKVHGTGIECGHNAQVWQQITTHTPPGLVLSLCPLSASYIWQEKQMCLFSCPCDDKRLGCDAAYLRLAYDNATVSVCEFQVL